MRENPTAQLIAREGVYGLGGYDGCQCTDFAVQGVEVSVSCRKSGVGAAKVAPGFYGIVVRVTSRRLDHDSESLKPVCDEVVRQLKPEGYDILVRNCAWEDDHNGRCVRCRQPRAQAAGYHCAKCEPNESASLEIIRAEVG